MVWVFTVIVYVFFVYGIIEFVKNVFYDIVRYKERNDEHSIEVIIRDSRELEYVISSLKKNFNHIVLALEQLDSNALRVIKGISDDVQIEYRIDSNQGEAEKSQEDF